MGGYRLFVIPEQCQDSSPATATDDAWTLVPRFGPSRELPCERLTACETDLPG